jgi:PAS domain-containing protein
MKNLFSFIKYLPLPVIIVNEKLEVIDVSKSVFQILKIRFFPEDTTNNLKAISDFIKHNTEIQNFINICISAMHNSGNSRKFHWEYNNSFFNINISMFSANENKYFILFFTDETKNKKIQINNARVRSYLESIMTSLYLGIIVMNKQMQITDINPTQNSFLKKMGKDLSLIGTVGMQLTDLVPAEQEVINTIKEEVLSKGAIYGGIVEKYPWENPNIVFSISFFPLRDETGNIVGMIRVCEDITEKNKLEQDLQQAELANLQIDTIQKLIITLNHKINNALMIIMGGAELLLKDKEALSAEQETILKTIVEQADIITEVTNKLENMENMKTTEYLKDGPDMIQTD